MFFIQIEKQKYYGEIAVSSLLTSIYNNGRYRKQIQEHTTNKTMPVFDCSLSWVPKIVDGKCLYTNGGRSTLCGDCRTITS